MNNLMRLQKGTPILEFTDNLPLKDQMTGQRENAQIEQAQVDLISSPRLSKKDDIMSLNPPASPTAAPAPNPTQSNLLKRLLGPALILLAASLFIVNQYTYKIAIDKYVASIHEMLLLLGLTSFLIGSVGLIITRESPLNVGGIDGLLVGLYSVLFVVDDLLFFTAVGGLPVSIVTTIASTLPAFVGVLSMIILRECMSIANAGATLGIIIGLTMIVKQPSALYGEDTKTDGSFAFYVGCMLAGEVVFSFIILINRKLGNRINYYILIFFVGIALVLVEAFILYLTGGVSPPSAEKFFVILGVHSTQCFGQVALYYAHKYAMAVTCSYYTFISIFVAFIVDTIIYNLGIGGVQIGGVVIVVASAIVIAIEKSIKERRQPPPINP